MLPKKERLSKNEVEFVLSKGKRSSSKLFNSKYVTNNLSHSRFSAVVNLKQAKNAVTRNRLRRQIYEAIRLNSQNPKAHLDIVIFLKTSEQKIDFETIQNEIIILLNKINAS